MEQSDIQRAYREALDATVDNIKRAGYEMNFGGAMAFFIGNFGSALKVSTNTIVDEIYNARKEWRESRDTVPEKDEPTPDQETNWNEANDYPKED